MKLWILGAAGLGLLLTVILTALSHYGTLRSERDRLAEALEATQASLEEAKQEVKTLEVAVEERRIREAAGTQRRSERQTKLNEVKELPHVEAYLSQCIPAELLAQLPGGVRWQGSCQDRD